jgi:hypothetical protein
MRAVIATLLAVLWILDASSFARGDPCAATPISGYLSGLYTLETTDCAVIPQCPPIHNDIWYLWTASSSENVAITLCGNAFSPVVEVYDNSGCPGLPVACSSGTCAASFSATIGSNYQIRIGTFNPAGAGSSGSFTIEEQYVQFCPPGVGGITSCPCGNPQIPAGSMKGCNNFKSGGTGGAILTASGAARIPADTLNLSMTNGLAAHVTVLIQGTTHANNRYGAGVRCIAGTLKRLYMGNPDVGGSINFPNNATPVHLESSAKGYTIVPGTTLYYFCAYRNTEANGQPGCPGLTFGFNSTNAVAVLWTP